MRARNLWAGVALALATATGMAQTPLPDQLGHVNDLAGAMSSEGAGRLGEVLANHAAASGIRIAVLTVENPVEESPEYMAQRALAIFLQGDSAQRGAMLVWTANGHVVVYVGEGLRAAITDWKPDVATPHSWMLSQVMRTSGGLPTLSKAAWMPCQISRVTP